MKLKKENIACALIVLGCIWTAKGEVCEANSPSVIAERGSRTGFYCPRLSDEKDEKFCCGNASVYLYCCSNATSSIYHEIHSKKQHSKRGNYIGLAAMMLYGLCLISLAVCDAISFYRTKKKRHKSNKLLSEEGVYQT